MAFSQPNWTPSECEGQEWSGDSISGFLGFGIKMLQDTEEIPEEENHGMDRIDARGLFIKKQTPKLLVFTSSKAYASSTQPEKIDSFIKREWNGGQ